MGRALVLGVDAEYASVISEVLARAFDTRMTTATEVALGLIASQAYDAVVIEAEAARAIPLRVLVQHVRSRLPAASIVVTWQGPVLSHQVVECFEADVDDCLAAPFHPSEFLARVTRGVRRAGRTRPTQDVSQTGKTPVAKSRRVPEAGPSEAPAHERRLPTATSERGIPDPVTRVRVPALVGEA